MPPHALNFLHCLQPNESHTNIRLSVNYLLMKANSFYGIDDPKSKTIYHLAAEHIFLRYELKYNAIAHEYEIRLKEGSQWKSLNLESLLIELESNQISISIRKLEILIKSDMVENYNPIEDYFKGLPKYDNSDHIAKFASYVPMIDFKSFEYHLRKWLVRAVRCALEPNYVNKQCLVLVHPGQNSGKSSWCRAMCPEPLRNYFTEELGYGKDANIQLTRNFLISLDDFDGEDSKTLGNRKAMMSKMSINERLPYDKRNSKLPRICSFLGSTNVLTFLKDPTGSVRWLSFMMNGKIDFSFKEEVDINMVWSQAYHLAYNDPDFNEELTFKDIQENETRNAQYRELTPEEEIVTKYFVPGDDYSEFKTSTEVVISLNGLNTKLNTVSMGKALTTQGFPRVKHPQRQIYGYLIKPLFKVSPFEIENV